MWRIFEFSKWQTFSCHLRTAVSSASLFLSFSQFTSPKATQTRRRPIREALYVNTHTTLPFLEMDATNEVAFQRLCHNLRENRSSMSVSLLDASIDQLRQLGDSIRDRRGFAHLKLCGGEIFHNPLDDGDGAVDAICHFIEQSPDFSMLELDSKCEAMSDACPSPAIPVRLVEALRRNENHEQKTIVLNGINVSCMIDSLGALMQKGALEVVVLGHLSEISQDDAVKLRLAMQTSKEGLESLHLRANLPTILCESLMAGLNGNPSLSSVLLDVLSEENAKHLGTLLESCPNLHYLSLSGAKISPRSLQALSSGLDIGSTLTLVDLSKCSLGSDHASSLASIIKKLRNANTLILDSNCIGLCGFRALCRGLYGHDALTDLSVVDNGIAGDVSEVLRGLFLHNHSIKSLSLEKNNLSMCQRHTWEAMAANKSICDVWLQDCFRSISSWSDIYQAYETLHHDVELDWSVNKNIDGATYRTDLYMHVSRSGGEPCYVKLRCDSTSAERLDWLVSSLRRKTCRIKKITMTSRLLSCGNPEFARALMECDSLETLCIVQSASSEVATVTSICQFLPNAPHLKRLEISGFVAGINDSLRTALERNCSLLWIDVPNVGKVEALQLHYFVLRNRVLSLRDAPISLIPLAFKHSLVQKPDLFCTFPKRPTFTFLALRDYWGLLGVNY